MGELISLADRRADRSTRANHATPAFFFDLCCPFSYLAAERVERLLGEVEWIAASSVEVGDGSWQLPEAAQLAAERRAGELRLPLVWPDRFPLSVPALLRAASYASTIGCGAQFALAAMRLAFCGGFDLEDPEILAEAAAAAGIPLDDCFGAIGNPKLDASLRATARGLRTRGVRRLPAVRVGSRLIDGELRLVEAAALLRAPAARSAG
ncbi:MAG TPA: DsbA family protein [Solirubrobacteraceae bacterium]|jgi:2-hydroxychromene-2-carboxylate isomerase|nr:DsbA family protein [Solirubrobacteraceae bacterium]